MILLDGPMMIDGDVKKLSMVARNVGGCSESSPPADDAVGTTILHSANAP